MSFDLAAPWISNSASGSICSTRFDGIGDQPRRSHQATYAASASSLVTLSDSSPFAHPLRAKSRTLSDSASSDSTRSFCAFVSCTSPNSARSASKSTAPAIIQLRMPLASLATKFSTKNGSFFFGGGASYGRRISRRRHAPASPSSFTRSRVLHVMRILNSPRML